MHPLNILQSACGFLRGAPPKLNMLQKECIIKIQQKNIKIIFAIHGVRFNHIINILNIMVTKKRKRKKIFRQKHYAFFNVNI